MASTYSPNLRLELIGTGDQQGTWGATTNTNLGTLLEQAIGGYQSVTVSNVADTTLTATNGAADQSRNMVLNLTGTISAARNVICPAIEKLYIVKNATTGGFAVTFKVSGQTGVSIPNGETALLYVDGTDARAVTGTLGFLGAAATGSTNTFTANQIISANSSSDALRITQTGAGNALLVEDTANPDSTPFVVATDGKVLAGTTTPSTIATGSPVVQISGGVSPLGLVRSAASSTPINLEFAKARGNGIPGDILVSGDTIGRLFFSGSDGAAMLPAAYIDASVDGTPGLNDMPGRIVFSTTADGASAPTERFRMNSSGALGIAGANFGTSGQVIVSGGSAAAPAWTSLGISNITGLQAALDGKQPLDAELTALAGLSTTADNFIVANGSTWTVETPSQVRTTLGLVIGTNVQAYDATLQSISALGTAADRFAYTTGVNTWAEATVTSAGRAILDDADASAQRTTLGLGTAATLNAGTSANNVVQLDSTAKLPAVDGSQLTNLPVQDASGRLLRAPQILTSGTSYTTPSGCNSIYAELIGGGGGGGGADLFGTPGSAGGAGGGSGAYCASYLSVSPSTSYTYAIGAGGTAGSTIGSDGGIGGSTTLTVGATTLTAGGGQGGLGNGTEFSRSGGQGGAASNGQLNVRGNGGGPGASDSGADNRSISGTGGPSFFGGGAQGVAGNSNGIAGVIGGGGSGGATEGTTIGSSGGVGGAGLIRIWEYA